MTRSMQDVLQAAGVEVRSVELWIEQRWLQPEGTPAKPTFSDGDVARARLIADLKELFGVNDEGVDVILHLVDQLHGMRRALALLRAELGDRS